MKQGILIVTILMLAVAGRAQNSGTDVTPIPSAPPPSNAAENVAAKQAADERFERLSADVQALQAANEDLQNKINGLEEEIRKLRDDEAHQSAQAVSGDDVKHLAEKIEEVDKKREEDKTTLTEEMRNSLAVVERAVGTGGGAPAPRPTPRAPVNDSPPPNVENGFVYTVQSGDSLSAIVHAYNLDFKSKGMRPITLKQARDANPTVDWGKLRVGQKIVIPRPAE